MRSGRNIWGFRKPLKRFRGTVFPKKWPKNGPKIDHGSILCIKKWPFLTIFKKIFLHMHFFVHPGHLKTWSEKALKMIKKSIDRFEMHFSDCKGNFAFLKTLMIQRDGTSWFLLKNHDLIHSLNRLRLCMAFKTKIEDFLTEPEPLKFSRTLPDPRIKFRSYDRTFHTEYRRKVT